MVCEDVTDSALASFKVALVSTGNDLTATSRELVRQMQQQRQEEQLQQLQQQQQQQQVQQYTEGRKQEEELAQTNQQEQSEDRTCQEEEPALQHGQQDNLEKPEHSASAKRKTGNICVGGGRGKGKKKKRCSFNQLENYPPLCRAFMLPAIQNTNLRNQKHPSSLLPGAGSTTACTLPCLLVASPCLDHGRGLYDLAPCQQP
eukprot:366431-Chlamydomonas_euryale.AAC.4